MAKKEKSFEESLSELEKLVSELEQGEVALEDAIKKYTEAMELSKICSEKLQNATDSINKIVKENGELEEFKNMDMES